MGKCVFSLKWVSSYLWVMKAEDKPTVNPVKKQLILGKWERVLSSLTKKAKNINLTLDHFRSLFLMHSPSHLLRVTRPLQRKVQLAALLKL